MKVYQWSDDGRRRAAVQQLRRELTFGVRLYSQGIRCIAKRRFSTLRDEAYRCLKRADESLCNGFLTRALKP
jgi:hypothetical protein